MEALARDGLRPLTYQEALARSSELLGRLKGKWFYLDGKGLKEDGFYTFSRYGELVALTGDEPIDHRVRVWPGILPLSLYIVSDYNANFNRRRFSLDADSPPSEVAPVIVGVKIGLAMAGPF